MEGASQVNYAAGSVLNCRKSARGPQCFSDVMAEFQRERFAGINPALLSVSRGEKPAFGRHWWEATKGASKDSDLAVCLLWLLAFTKHC